MITDLAAQEATALDLGLAIAAAVVATVVVGGLTYLIWMAYKAKMRK